MNSRVHRICISVGGANSSQMSISFSNLPTEPSRPPSLPIVPFSHLAALTSRLSSQATLPIPNSIVSLFLLHPSLPLPSFSYSATCILAPSISRTELSTSTPSSKLGGVPLSFQCRHFKLSSKGGS